MSFDAIKWAINQDIDDPKEKLLLVVLSDFLNDKSRQCNPSRETLMRKACIKNNKTLSSKLDSLASRGLIEIVRGKGVSNHYLVQNRTTFSTEPRSAVNHVQQCTTTQFSTEPTPSSAVNHEPINEPIKEPINNSIESAPNFSLTAPEKTAISKKETVEKKPKRPKKEKVPCPYNEDDPIPEEFLKIAQKHNIQDPQQLFSKMVAYCKANGKQYADYKAAFTTWCLNESKWQQQKPPNQASKSFAYEPPGGFTDEFYMKGCKFDKDGNLIL
jgi:hypothetical protein|nr:MAG TPA_asm: Replication initiator A family protein [Caudoviricetes sp.]